MHVDTDPNASFRKFNFLLENPPFPPEAFANLLLLYLKHNYHDLAADVLANYPDYTYSFLTKELYDFIEASIHITSAPEEAFQKFEVLTASHIDALRRYTKQIQDARLARNQMGIKEALRHYDDALEG